MPTNKTRVQKKKEEVKEKIEKLDPNNNRNIQNHQLIKKRGKKVRDDGFEHRTSRETSI
jgi:hypothetical protein